MVYSKALDLSEIDPSVWRIIVSDRVYGPFTLGQLRVFILDGRINARSKIAEGELGRIQTAGDFEQLASAFAERQERAKPRELANFVIIAHLESESEVFVEALNQLGTFTKAMPGVFLLRSDIRLAAVHTRLSDVIHSDEKIMIVDATNDKLAWLGLELEANDHMNAVWNKAA